ncbi:MAG: hypothetical protein A2036_02705 [Omnitrophica bacterium GWA2_50_21]|nr:MAG: hypothetical protein A2036_02705 [Omnitrophica bacterium GWA2_50_21]
MPKVVVSAIGKDQPGIVSSVTGILYRHGASIEDSSMTILEENFAMIMIVSLPREATAAEFAEDFRKLEKKQGLLVSIATPKQKPHVGPVKSQGTPIMVSVLGSDKPGIVHQVSKLLAGLKINITDLNTKVIGREGKKNIYAMIVEVELPPPISPAKLQGRLSRLAKTLKVDISSHPIESLTL